ncbi:MAG TPA: hypothetical protein VG815_13260 [Chloroflexota bacterium]|jgi:hypothetical protein|nr:hypothetical protein [Chloroflexota bacterium]
MTTDQDHQSLTSSEVRKDLQATLGARSELGPEMDEHLIGAFLDRIETRIEVRVKQAVAEARKIEPPVPRAKSGNLAGVMVPSIALSIPLIAIAGAMAGGWGIAAVMATVLFINVMYFLAELLG